MKASTRGSQAEPIAPASSRVGLLQLGQAPPPLTPRLSRALLKLLTNVTSTEHESGAVPDSCHGDVLAS